jgi:hypothetical protein
MSEWKSVKEELPRDKELCLVCYEWDDRHMGQDITYYYEPSNLKGTGKRYWAKEMSTQHFKITHWQYLPEVPREVLY